MKKFAVILSGCGVYDGAEIHEAVMAMYAIASQGAHYHLFAPDVNQHHVVNHLNGEVMDETRNVLVESARIGRGHVQPLSELTITDFDALLFPGGFGAAKNLSSFAFDGAACTVHAEVKKIVKDARAGNKPIGAMCISPVVLARVLGEGKLTIGNDPETAEAVAEMGAIHAPTTHAEVVVDTNLKLYSSPCYMLDASIVQIAEGAQNLVRAILDDMR